MARVFQRLTTPSHRKLLMQRTKRCKKGIICSSWFWQQKKKKAAKIGAQQKQK
jgi:hypothetical protein